MLIKVCFGDLWLTRSVLALYNNWTLKMKLRHRYSYTDLALTH